MRSLLTNGNNKGTFSSGAIESNLGGEKLIQNVGKLSMRKIGDFEPFV